MSKINPNIKKGVGAFMAHERLAGGQGLNAAKQDNLQLLKRLVYANLLWENNAYVDGETTANQIKKLIPLCNAADVAEVCIAAREEQKLRHTPLFIAVCMLKHEVHKTLVPFVLEAIITRPDMMTDFLAIYERENGKLKPLAHAAQRGLAECFAKFNEYQFAKYDRDGKIKLRDVMFLTRPKPIGREQTKLFKKIAERTLDTPDTWEVALSTGKDKKETWTRLIKEGKLGALAFLRNLRNMKQVNVDANVIRKGLKEIKSSMLLPLNFFAAVKHAPEFVREIEELMLRTYKDLPKLSGHTIFIVDVSGSMGSVVSEKSEYSRLGVASAMAMLAMFQCESVEIWCTAGIDTYRSHQTSKIDYPTLGFALIDQIVKLGNKLGGGGIFTRQCLEYIQHRSKADRVIVFSDSQDCDNVKTKPKPFGKFNYIVDVSAHQHGVNYKGVWTAEISGWSEHFLTYIAASEGLQNTFDVED
jgi:60 kDa SS-A/Ro ribonucleoprotein